MSDLIVGPRAPVRIEVKLSSPIRMDLKARIVIFEASNDVLLDTYQVGVPLAVLKAVVGQAIAQEAENEARTRSNGGIATPKLSIVRPT